MSERRGFFVVIDGPSGVGKTTVTALLHEQLSDRGLSVVATKEPSGSTLGNLARHSTDDYKGLVLACLVTADRYQHLERDVRPALRAGCVVLCDRYVPTSLVLQRMDGVDPAFLRQMNQYADVPDLTIILTGDPTQSWARAHQRGTYSRFHCGDGGTEAALYRAVARELAEAGWSVVHHEVADDPADTVAADLLETILERRGERSGRDKRGAH
jgi:dTMP kinase